MPKLERLDWLEPLNAGHGVTLTDRPEANMLLAEDPDALILGVLYDSQFRTKLAFAIPLRLKDRLGHVDIRKLAAMDNQKLKDAFKQPDSLHRFPFKFADLTQKLAQFVTDRYDGHTERIWTEAKDPDDLGKRLMELPAFGAEKTNWTIGMLGRLGMLKFGGWEDYRVPTGKKKAST